MRMSTQTLTRVNAFQSKGGEFNYEVHHDLVEDGLAPEQLLRIGQHFVHRLVFI